MTDNFAALPGFYRLVFLHVEPRSSRTTSLPDRLALNIDLSVLSSVNFYSCHICVVRPWRKLVLSGTNPLRCTNPCVIG